MRLLISMLLAAGFAAADKIAVQTIACKDEKSLTEMPKEVLKDELKLIQYATKHQCVILSENDRIQVAGTDSAASKKAFIPILLERTGEHYFVPRSAVIIEQPGQKNRFTF